MSKGRTFLGALLGAIIGAGLLVLFIWLSDRISYMVYISPAGWLIGGLLAGIIAQGPGRGAVAGFLTALFAFVINTLVIVFVVVLGGTGIFAIVFEIATFGRFDPATLSPIIGILIAIGILVSLVVSAILGVVSIIAGLIGGAINNPGKSKTETYQEYPEESFR
ncbi:MAG: hypothetical protein KGD59_07145 [Candidatus Heimdallarchaeota archaeon]|nr:hypothetical protein [Candidatus Heimdallarchaeota archaeon]MBY8994309.1 hypothetical protein [Candidatus Heimdallarchaeota archaeon]